MKAYPIEFQILDDENQNEVIATLKGFDEFSVSLTIKNQLISSDEEIDRLAYSIKQCLKSYVEGLK